MSEFKTGDTVALRSEGQLAIAMRMELIAAGYLSADERLPDHIETEAVFHLLKSIAPTIQELTRQNMEMAELIREAQDNFARRQKGLH